MRRITSETKPTRKLTVLEVAKKEESRLKMNNKKQTTQTGITKLINCQSPTQTRTIVKKNRSKTKQDGQPKIQTKTNN